MTLRALPVLLLLLCGAGCGGRGPDAASAKRSRPTDDDACPRMCATFDACGKAPADCEQRCRKDQTRLLSGVFASVTACFEDALAPPSCGRNSGEGAPRAGTPAEALRTCFSATVEAYASRNDGTARRGIVAAVCRRRARCGGGAADEPACVAELDDPKAAWSKVVAVARREDVARMARCVEERPCAEADPVGSCSSP